MEVARVLTLSKSVLVLWRGLDLDNARKRNKILKIL